MKHSFKTSVRRNRSLFRFKGIAPEEVFSRIPELRGRRLIHVSFRPMLTAYKGKLLSKSHKGDAVYAGSFLRKRRIVLEEQMLKTPRVLERIFVHEVFHFVWSKLGNRIRLSFEALIRDELDRGVKGELGWSAESLKLKLAPEDLAERTRKWKDYLCESFCDTGGWYFGSAQRYSEMTLDRNSRAERRRWVRKNLLGTRRPLTV
jgi:hypothetical protein